MKRIRPSNESLKKDIRAYFGSSGSGKSHQLKLAIKNEKRLLIFDPDHEYSMPGIVTFHSLTDYVRAVEKASDKNFRFALQLSGQKAFDIFCRVAWWERSAKKSLCVIIDELAGVDRVMKAEGAWHSLLTRGRKYALKIRAGAQSPSEISKTLMRQKSFMWVGMLERGQDWQYMAKETGQPEEEFKALRGEPFFDSLEFIQGKMKKNIAVKPRIKPKSPT